MPRWTWWLGLFLGCLLIAGGVAETVRVVRSGDGGLLFWFGTLVGGGALSDVGTGLAGIVLATSAPHPSNPRRWSASGHNFDTAASHNLRAVAFCARS